jgi:predicted nucleic acid-binding protein
MINNDGKMFIPFVLVTEFVNRVQRNCWKLYKEKTNRHNLSYKDYRGTSDFADITGDIKTILETQIFKYAEECDCTYSFSDAVKFLDSSEMDINDSLYLKIAKEKSIPIVTNDRDFLNVSDVCVITALTAGIVN